MNYHEISTLDVRHVSSNAVFPVPGSPIYLLLILMEGIFPCGSRVMRIQIVYLIGGFIGVVGT